MNASAVPAPASTLLARSMSAAAASQSIQPTGPEQAGRFCSGEAKRASISDSSGKPSSPVPSGGEEGPP